MLPGKRYTPEDVLDVLRRRFWLVLVPAAIVAAATAVAARRLPDLYKAEAIVAVVPQVVPESIVRPTVSGDLDDRVQAIRNLVLSRPRLEKLILDFNLYPEERRTGIMQDIVETMKTEHLAIQQTGKGGAYSITYFGRDAITTQKVAAQVASAFIDESLTDRSRAAERTNEFLESALQTKEQELLDRERKLMDYKQRHAGELPTQLEANLRAVSDAEGRITQILQAINTARQNKILQERQRNSERETPANSVLSPADPGRPAPPGSAAEQLAAMQRKLAEASARLTAIHPDVVRYTAQVKDLEEKAAAEALASPGPGTAGLPAGASPAEIARARRIDDLERQIAQIDDEIAKYLAEEKRLRQLSNEYRGRVAATPTRDAELTELTRDYGIVNESYQGLRRKSESTSLSYDLERREIGEQFRLLEQAKVPARPFSPDRIQITFMGLGAGLALGLALIALGEYRDSGFKTDDQVASVLALPVLAVVPVMQSDPERRRRLAWNVLWNIGLGTTVAGCLAVLAYTFVR